MAKDQLKLAPVLLRRGAAETARPRRRTGRRVPYQERGITFALLQSQLSQAGACYQDSAAAATHLSPPTEGLRTTFCLAPESASSSWCARCKGSAPLQRSRGRGDAPVAAHRGARHHTFALLQSQLHQAGALCRGSAALQRQHQDLPSPELARTYAIAEPQ